MKNGLSIRFWGVRGSVPCPGPDTVRYGGNTPCVEMRAGGLRLVFDGGTGLRALGDALASEMPLTLHLFFSHVHWDHIQGFPFFVPAFSGGNILHVYDILPESGVPLEECLRDQMRNPNFPVPLHELEAALHFHRFEAGDTLELDADEGQSLRIRTQALNHPGGCVGYRVEWAGTSAVYMTDHEHGDPKGDERACALAAGADILVVDAAYTGAEYSAAPGGKQGWGHSTWEAGVQLARDAGVRKLVLFHHEPKRTDAELDEMGRLAMHAFPETLVAREGQTLELAPRGQAE